MSGIEKGSPKPVPRQLQLENWLPVDGFPGYEISQLGNVRSQKKGKPHLLKPQRQSAGYYQVWLSRGGEVVPLLVHRLVVQAFRGDIPDDKQVNHLDGNKTNNFIENLEVVTPRENMRHAYDNGLARAARGEQHGRAKLSEEQVREILRQDPQTINCAAVARDYEVNTATVWQVVHGQTWTHITREEEVCDESA